MSYYVVLCNVDMYFYNNTTNENPISPELKSKMKEIKNLKVRSAYVDTVEATYGVYDLVVRMKSENIEDMRELTTWKLRRIQGIKSTITLPTVE